VLGGELVGLVIGTYSSVFAATPLALLFHRKWPLPKAEPRPKRDVRDPADSGAVI
jgi:SecD/SecF fusion protein